MGLIMSDATILGVVSSTEVPLNGCILLFYKGPKRSTKFFMHTGA